MKQMIHIKQQRNQMLTCYKYTWEIHEPALKSDSERGLRWNASIASYTIAQFNGQLNRNWRWVTGHA